MIVPHPGHESRSCFFRLTQLMESPEFQFSREEPVPNQREPGLPAKREYGAGMFRWVPRTAFWTGREHAGPVNCWDALVLGNWWVMAFSVRNRRGGLPASSPGKCDSQSGGLGVVQEHPTISGVCCVKVSSVILSRGRVRKLPCPAGPTAVRKFAPEVTCGSRGLPGAGRNRCRRSTAKCPWC